MRQYLQIINRTVFFLLMFILCASDLLAQTQRISKINQKEEHHLKSKINGVEYNLYISLPQYYSQKDTTRYPILYMLDGGLEFPIAHATNGALGMFGEFPDLIIVGIEYEWKESLSPWFRERSRDYTVTKDTAFNNNKIFADLFDLPKGSLSSGGAPTFSNVIRKEIIPFIEKEYRTNGDRGISGHSFGGLFAGYCLLNAADIFNKFGINSPSFWWDKKIIFTMEKTFAEGHKELPVKVFMSVGGDEGESMTPVMTGFADSLKSRNYQGLDLTTHVFEGEDHMSVVPAMISRTLRVLYVPKKK